MADDLPPVEYRPTIKDLPQAERPRERLEHYGAGALSVPELLAIVLRSGVRGESVLRLAERLLWRYKNLAGLARASFAELQGEKGVGPAKAAQIHAALELGRRLTLVSPDERPQVRSPADAANLVMSEMGLLEQEHLRVLLLDMRKRVLRIETVYKGSLNSSMVRVCEVFREAIRANAVSLIVVHNHPSGDPAPSPEDVTLTEQIVQAGRLLSIEVLDHLIIGQQRFISLKERGMGFG
jgi:DNA repair protein RadC